MNECEAESTHLSIAKSSGKTLNIELDPNQLKGVFSSTKNGPQISINTNTPAGRQVHTTLTNFLRTPPRKLTNNFKFFDSDSDQSSLPNFQNKQEIEARHFVSDDSRITAKRKLYKKNQISQEAKSMRQSKKKELDLSADEEGSSVELEIQQKYQMEGVESNASMFDDYQLNPEGVDSWHDLETPCKENYLYRLTKQGEAPVQVPMPSGNKEYDDPRELIEKILVDVQNAYGKAEQSSGLNREKSSDISEVFEESPEVISEIVDFNSLGLQGIDLDLVERLEPCSKGVDEVKVSIPSSKVEYSFGVRTHRRKSSLLKDEPPEIVLGSEDLDDDGKAKPSTRKLPSFKKVREAQKLIIKMNNSSPEKSENKVKPNEKQKDRVLNAGAFKDDVLIKDSFSRTPENSMLIY